MNFRNLRVLIGCLLLLGLVACEDVAPTPSATAIEEARRFTFPGVRFVAPAETLCREASQLRLQPLVEGEWPQGEAATWTVRDADATAPLLEGTWAPAERDLFVALPKGESFPPGLYTVTLEMAGESLGRHTFKVLEQPPTLVTTTLGYTPDGPYVEAFAAPLPVFYVHYRYEGVCPGTPLWVAVRQEDALLVNRQTTLEAVAGEGALPCYAAGGELFESGAYSVTLGLGGGPVTTLPFRIESGEVPPRRYTPRCGAPFTAIGLSPDGEPFQPTDTFPWYTQGVYVGAACRGLPPTFPWSVTWYRNGEALATHTGQWQGAERETVWDSLGGTENNPFLIAGTYTVTLTISDTLTLETGFRVVPYVPSESETGD